MGVEVRELVITMAEYFVDEIYSIHKVWVRSAPVVEYFRLHADFLAFAESNLVIWRIQQRELIYIP
jgi:hypothetical protein